jgi:uncharacterized protein
MVMPVELGSEECVRLLRGGVAGRVAVCTPSGPHVIPLNYLVVEEHVVVRTSPLSVLGTYGRGAFVAFQIDAFDYENHEGWSVVARGKAEEITDAAELRRVRAHGSPRPWADGTRSLFLRIPWSELSGRRVGHGLLEPVRRTLSAERPDA